MTVKIELTFNTEQLKKLEQIPLMVRVQAADHCLHAMAEPVVEKAFRLAPRSLSTGTRLKWSKKLARSARWRINSGEYLGLKVIKHNKGGVVYIGAKYPKGNKQQFSVPKKEQRTHYRWGKPGQEIQTVSRAGNKYTYTRQMKEKTLQFPTQDRFIQKAFDETKSQQLAAFNKAFANVIKGLNFG
jgi:hypothetical protein